jgi:hypothetical protein
MTYANDTDRVVRIVEYDLNTGAIVGVLESVRYSGRNEDQIYDDLILSAEEKGHALIRLDNTLENGLPSIEKIKIIEGVIVENVQEDLDTSDWDLGWGVWDPELHTRDFS